MENRASRGGGTGRSAPPADPDLCSGKTVTNMTVNFRVRLFSRPYFDDCGGAGAAEACGRPRQSGGRRGPSSPGSARGSPRESVHAPLCSRVFTWCSRGPRRMRAVGEPAPRRQRLRFSCVLQSFSTVDSGDRSDHTSREQRAPVPSRPVPSRPVPSLAGQSPARREQSGDFAGRSAQSCPVRLSRRSLQGLGVRECAHGCRGQQGHFSLSSKVA